MTKSISAKELAKELAVEWQSGMSQHENTCENLEKMVLQAIKTAIKPLEDKFLLLKDILEDIRPWINNACSMVREGEIVRQNKDGTVTRFENEGWWFNPAEKVNRGVKAFSSELTAIRERIISEAIADNDVLWARDVVNFEAKISELESQNALLVEALSEANALIQNTVATADINWLEHFTEHGAVTALIEQALTNTTQAAKERDERAKADGFNEGVEVSKEYVSAHWFKLVASGEVEAKLDELKKDVV